MVTAGTLSGHLAAFESSGVRMRLGGCTLWAERCLSDVDRVITIGDHRTSIWR